MSSTILCTCFEPFNGKKTNTSMEVIKYINCDYKVILPVSYSRSTVSLKEAIELYKPDFVLSLGEANRSGSIEIEKYAHNIKSATICDNDGVIKENEPITEGPLALTSSNDLYQITKKLASEGFNVRLSYSAGGYICNLVMYNLLLIKDSKIIKDGAFIHIPHLDEVEESDVQNMANCLNKFLEYFTN